MERLHHSPPPRDSRATTPDPAPTTPPGTSGALEPAAGCLLHTVMDQLAHTAVRQHVLHSQGEALPRADLVDALDGWQQLYHLVRTQVCPATRAAPLTPADLAACLDTTVPGLLPPTVSMEVRARLRRQLVACATCASVQDCPLGMTEP